MNPIFVNYALGAMIKSALIGFVVFFIVLSCNLPNVHSPLDGRISYDQQATALNQLPQRAYRYALVSGAIVFVIFSGIGITYDWHINATPDHNQVLKQQTAVVKLQLQTAVENQRQLTTLAKQIKHLDQHQSEQLITTMTKKYQLMTTISEIDDQPQRLKYAQAFDEIYRIKYQPGNYERASLSHVLNSHFCNLFNYSSDLDRPIDQFNERPIKQQLVKMVNWHNQINRMHVTNQNVFKILQQKRQFRNFKKQVHHQIETINEPTQRNINARIYCQITNQAYNSLDWQL